MFSLHPQLAQDCAELGDMPLSKVLLLNDSNYPWLVLVPRREDVREIFQLSGADQQQLLTESSAVSAAMAEYFNADKMNVAALGNMVPQLHLHHIVRYQSDPAWPQPVWGKVPAIPYSEENKATRIQELRDLLSPQGLSWS